jgi:DNA polymerase-3 subunit delta
MPKSYSDWQSVLQKGNLPPLMGFGGDERAFVDEALSEIRKRVLVSGLADFNHDVLSAKSVSADAIVGSANTLPVMAPLRLVEVRDADAIKGDAMGGLEAYLKSPSPTTVLVFIFDGIDVRQKFPKALDAAASVFKFEHPKEDQMLPLLKKRAQVHKLAFDAESASMLIMEVGTDLLMLERALEKLALGCEAGQVSVHDVMEQVAETRLVDAFALGRAVSMGDRKEAAICLAKLKMAQEVPLRLVGMLAWQLRQVLKARLLLDEGLGEQEIGRSLNAYGDRLRPLLSAARKWRTEVHATRLTRLTGLDRELKSSRAPAWLWLERVVFQLCPKG